MKPTAIDGRFVCHTNTYILSKDRTLNFEQVDNKSIFMK